MDKNTEKYLKVQRDLAELVKESEAGDFATYHAMVWYGINGMKCVWMEMDNDTGEDFSDYMKGKLCLLVDQCESIDWEEIVKAHENHKNERN